MSRELILVMPVYNEQDCIAQVIRSWEAELTRLGIDFSMIVIDDGSTDRTKEVLASFTGDDRIVIIHKENTGHGPTILLGYREAVNLGTWVFQCDSDDEVSPQDFEALWTRRQEYAALFGVRSDREQSRSRKMISFVSRTTVRFLFGRGVSDVNVPYRLMKSNVIVPILRQIPSDTFAPNVIISGALARSGLAIYNHPVEHRQRRTGKPSLVKWSQWRAAVKSFWQTVKCRILIR
jgi:glycosyltransferase involved in cell wall biosynthesis